MRSVTPWKFCALGWEAASRDVVEFLGAYLRAMTNTAFSVIIIIFSFIANVAVSNGYLYNRLCRPSPPLVRAVFAATFGISASLLQLCLWEIHGSLQNEYIYEMSLLIIRVRGIAWRLVIRALLADLILVIPLFLSYALFMGRTHNKSKFAKCLTRNILPYYLLLNPICVA